MSLMTPAPRAFHEAVRYGTQTGLRPERPQQGPPAPRRLNSTELLDGEREIEIEHAGAVYRLRRTSLGKLILTK